MPLFLPPDTYTFALTDTAIRRYLPQLRKGENFEFTSLKTDNYKCVAWTLSSEEDWIQFQDDNGEWDIRLNRYIDYFKGIGFIETTDTLPVKDMIRIALYADEITNTFTHVARQLLDGKWTSKLGEWEDITHDLWKC